MILYDAQKLHNKFFSQKYICVKFDPPGSILNKCRHALNQFCALLFCVNAGRRTSTQNVSRPNCTFSFLSFFSFAPFFDLGAYRTASGRNKKSKPP